MRGDSKWPNLIVRGHPQYKNIWKGHRLLHPPKSTWIPYDTQKWCFGTCITLQICLPSWWFFRPFSCLSNFTASTVPRASPNSFKEPPTLCGVMGLYRNYPVGVNKNIMGEWCLNCHPALVANYSKKTETRTEFIKFGLRMYEDYWICIYILHNPNLKKRWG